MSAVPSEWRCAALAEAATIVLGQSPPGSSYNTTGRGLPFFQGKAEFGDLVPEIRKWTTAGTKFACVGDILISVRAPVGPTNLAPVDCAIGRGLAAIRASEGVDQRYLLWAIRATVDRLIEHGTGSTFEAINGKQLRDHRVPIAPFVEQRRIVDILEDHLSRLTAADAYLSAASERQASFLESRLSNLPTLAGAERVPLGRLLAEPLRHGRSVPTASDGFAVLRLTAIRQGRIDLSERKIGAWRAEDAKQYLVQKGDFLVSRGNGSRALVGRGGLVMDDSDPVAYPDTAIRVRPDQRALDPTFLAIVWDLREVRRQIERTAKTTAGIYKINQADLRAIKIPVPDLRNQKIVVGVGQESGSSARRLAEQVRGATARTVALRRSLVQAAFSGRLTASSTNLDLVEGLASV